MLDISYYITALEVLSSVFFLLAIIYWRWRTSYAVEKVTKNRKRFMVHGVEII